MGDRVLRICVWPYTCISHVSHEAEHTSVHWDNVCTEEKESIDSFKQQRRGSSYKDEECFKENGHKVHLVVFTLDA